MRDYNVLYERMGYVFRDPSLLDRALTHSSASSVHYERLEFLGDSIVNYAVSDFLFHGSHASEGELTKKRASMVSKRPLAYLSDKLGFSAMCLYRNCSLSEKMKCDLYESVTAAIALDGGIGKALDFVKRTILCTPVVSHDYKSELKELCEKNKWKYETAVTESGSEHNKKFIVEVRVEGKAFGVATAKTIKEAENEACALVLPQVKAF